MRSKGTAHHERRLRRLAAQQTAQLPAKDERIRHLNEEGWLRPVIRGPPVVELDLDALARRLCGELDARVRALGGEQQQGHGEEEERDGGSHEAAFRVRGSAPSDRRPPRPFLRFASRQATPARNLRTLCAARLSVDPRWTVALAPGSARATPQPAAASAPSA